MRSSGGRGTLRVCRPWYFRGSRFCGGRLGTSRARRGGTNTADLEGLASVFVLDVEVVDGEGLDWVAVPAALVELDRGEEFANDCSLTVEPSEKLEDNVTELGVKLCVLDRSSLEKVALLAVD